MRLSMITLAAFAALGVAAAPLAQAEAAPKKRVYVCDYKKSKANNGTLIGGASGALLGSAVAGNGAKTEGAVLGGVVGAVAGHQIAKKNAKRCYYTYR